MLKLVAHARSTSADGVLYRSGESLLCKKKDLIIEKFDELLKKLGGEELSANITMGRVSKEWKEAMEVSPVAMAVWQAKRTAQSALCHVS